jgi:CRISPR-associated protein Cmr2
LRLFDDLRGFLAREEVSRRAAYHVAEWLDDVPGDIPALAASMLGYQMARQCRDGAKPLARELAARLVALRSTRSNARAGCVRWHGSRTS